MGIDGTAIAGEGARQDMSAGLTITIDPRFRGPDGSGNGGYVCGRVAAHLDGPASVTLRHPPPLASPLAVARENGEVRVLDGDTLVAEARAWDVPIEPPPPVPLDTAMDAAMEPADLADHPFPRCFVCGPERNDGMRIFPGELGDGLAAGPWTPQDDLVAPDGQVDPTFLWAALDCPSGWIAATLVEPGTVAVLGRLSADIRGRPAPGDHCVTVAQADGREGRKLASRSAIYTASGDLLAAASALWIIIHEPA